MPPMLYSCITFKCWEGKVATKVASDRLPPPRPAKASIVYVQDDVAYSLSFAGIGKGVECSGGAGNTTGRVRLNSSFRANDP